MMNNTALRFAVSALAIVTTMVACKPAAEAIRPLSASQAVPSAKNAADAFAKAQAAVAKGKLADALGYAEQAVQASPRDIGYRMLLADLYLKNGRFQSAATTYGDVLSFDGGNKRAQFNLALCDVALGRNDVAIGVLDTLAPSVPAADIGLAYALAGQPQRAVALLEPAARADNATPRVRQNLALAYALAGDWQKARVTAAQDISPADLGDRMAKWAAIAQPSGPADQVAAVLGVTPASDAGQPQRLALAQPDAPVALAAADPAPAPVPAATPAPAEQVAAAPDPAPVAETPARTVTASSDLPTWMAGVRQSQDPQPAADAHPREVTRPLYADAVHALVTPQPAVLHSVRTLRLRTASFATLRSAAPAAHRDGTGGFAVQIGAFSTPANVERAWAQAYKRYGFADHTPLSTTVSLPGRGTFHRLSVAGFDRGEADRVCASVRSKGGVCFVRAVAGDVPTRWASRYANTRRG
jgi:Flp pilus assembly protein TadD